MSEHKHRSQEVPKDSDPKERLYIFATSLFNRLHPKSVAEAENDDMHVVKSVVDLSDGSELEVRYESVKSNSEDTTDLVTLVQRRKNRHTGKVEDFLYGVNASAVQAKLRSQLYDPDDLHIYMNDNALKELQISPQEAIEANISPADVVLAHMKHFDLHNAAGEAIMASLLGEAMKQPDHAWHR